MKSKLTIRHSNRHFHFHFLAVDVHSLAAALHAADILAGRSSLGYARPDNMNPWHVAHGHNHRRSGLEDGPT